MARRHLVSIVEFCSRPLQALPLTSGLPHHVSQRALHTTGPDLAVFEASGQDCSAHPLAARGIPATRSFPPLLFLPHHLLRMLAPALAHPSGLTSPPHPVLTRRPCPERSLPLPRHWDPQAELHRQCPIAAAWHPHPQSRDSCSLASRVALPSSILRCAPARGPTKVPSSMSIRESGSAGPARVSGTGQHRHMSSGSLPPGAVSQQRQIKVFLQSPGVIADPYKPPPPPLPFFRRFFTLDGWKRIREGLLASLRTGYAIAMLRRNTKGYTRNGFYSEIVHAYCKINQALAADDRTSLRHFVTESTFSSLKGQLKQRGQAGIAKAVWRLAGGAPRISTLQARLVALDQKKPENSFIQVTLSIKSKQAVAVYDKKGKIISGNPDSEVDVEDIWVFERHLKQPQSQWRLCGQLAQAPK